MPRSRTASDPCRWPLQPACPSRYIWGRDGTNGKIQYKQVHIEFIQSQHDLAEAFYTLSQNIVKYAKFQHIDDDDAIQEGVVICFEKINHFNPEKGKAFNYMTTCILNHFRQLYRSARNYQELKKRYLNYLQNEFEKTIIHNGKIHSTTSVIPVDNTRSID